MRSSSGANAVISLVFVSTGVWPSTTPLAWSRAPSRCTARPSARRAPRTVLPSTAIARTGPLLAGALLAGALLGWFALGWFALGWFALGWFALGWFALGWFALGWFALGVATRRASQPLTAVSSSSASTRCKTRRNVDSLGVARPMPRRSRTETGRSWAHSAIATYERAPASTAHTAAASTVTNR